MLELICGPSRLVLLPETGGAVGAWQVEGRDVFSPTALPVPSKAPAASVGAFPLMPYCGALAGGKFSFAGEEHTLVSSAESVSFHGNAWRSPWTVAHKTDSQAILVFDHCPKADLLPDLEGRVIETDEMNESSWPFAYRAVMEYVLHRDGLNVTMVVENRSQTAQPVGFGLWTFQSASEEAMLSFRAKKVWLNAPDGLPCEAVPCEGAWDFRKGQPLLQRTLDNSFAGFGGRAELDNGRNALCVHLEADPIFSHLSVKAEPGKGFVGVGPMSGMPDALNRPGVAGGGTHVLEPGARIGGNLRFTVSSEKNSAGERV